MRRRHALLIAALLCATGTAATDAAALGQRTLERRLGGEMRRAGAASGAYVENLTTGERVFAVRSTRDRIPASNEKLWTTVAALARFGETGTFATTALGTRPLTAAGVLRGNLYLRGSGDPTLSSARLEVLAQDLADAGLTRVKGTVIGDESAFDRRRGPAGRGTDFDVGAPLGALVVDRSSGGTGDPAPYAAGIFVRELRDAGVRVHRRTRSGVAPANATELAVAESASVRDIVAAMNVPSDNFIAEMLLKAVGVAGRAHGTTRRGAAYARRVARDVYGVTPQVFDGSGLSRRDATNPRELVDLLSQAFAEDAFFRSLAVMGVSGTLAGRLGRSAARGRCRGKTGTLSDVSALSGYCETLGGDVLAYSIMMNRANVYSARTIQDRMVDLIVRLD